MSSSERLAAARRLPARRRLGDAFNGRDPAPVSEGTG